MSDVTIFRSQDPSSYVKAVAIIRANKIHFRCTDSHEGGSKTPRTMHMIAVSSEYECAARRSISSIPSEIIITSDPSSPTRGDRVIAWIQVLTILFFLAFALIKAYNLM